MFFTIDNELPPAPGFASVSETELSSCITVLHRLCVDAAEPNSPVIGLLAPVMGVLFHMFIQVWEGVSFLRKLVTELIQVFIASLEEVIHFPTAQIIFTYL